MPYRKVQFAQGRFYHVCNRGIERQPIFREQENYEFLLRRIEQYAHDLDIGIIAYCLMSNHYHLLLR
jgi:REP element-mobilizing transposase RayT